MFKKEDAFYFNKASDGAASGDKDTALMEKAREALKKKSQAERDEKVKEEQIKMNIMPQKLQLSEGCSIGKIIAVASGKGGVGKSTVTALLATALRKEGKSVGIIDADITGPSIPHLFGLKERILSDGSKIIPAVSKTGIKVVSVNLMLENVNNPLVWRGPMMSDLLNNFYAETLWHDLDYLLIDLPPGTGDVPLTVFQMFEVDGIILVTSPQDLVSMVVHKAANMAKKMEIPIIGLIENYSYFLCPDNGKKYEIFGKSKIDEVAEEFKIPLLTRLPIDPEMAEICDAGLSEAAADDLIEKFKKPIEVLEKL